MIAKKNENEKGNTLDISFARVDQVDCDNVANNRRRSQHYYYYYSFSPPRFVLE